MKLCKNPGKYYPMWDNYLEKFLSQAAQMYTFVKLVCSSCCLYKLTKAYTKLYALYSSPRPIIDASCMHSSLSLKSFYESPSRVEIINALIYA